MSYRAQVVLRLVFAVPILSALMALPPDRLQAQQLTVCNGTFDYDRDEHPFFSRRPLPGGFIEYYRGHYKREYYAATGPIDRVPVDRYGDRGYDPTADACSGGVYYLELYGTWDTRCTGRRVPTRERFWGYKWNVDRERMTFPMDLGSLEGLGDFLFTITNGYGGGDFHECSATVEFDTPPVLRYLAAGENTPTTTGAAPDQDDCVEVYSLERRAFLPCDDPERAGIRPAQATPQPADRTRQPARDLNAPNCNANPRAFTPAEQARWREHCGVPDPQPARARRTPTPAPPVERGFVEPFWPVAAQPMRPSEWLTLLDPITKPLTNIAEGLIELAEIRVRDEVNKILAGFDREVQDWVRSWFTTDAGREAYRIRRGIGARDAGFLERTFRDINRYIDFEEEYCTSTGLSNEGAGWPLVSWFFQRNVWRCPRR